MPDNTTQEVPTETIEETVPQAPVEETPVETAPEPEAPVVDPVAPIETTDVAPEDTPITHNDDGSVSRELEHVVNQ